MNNNLEALNNHLFEVLERLNDDELMKGEAALAEIDRAKAITGVAKTVIDNAALALKGAELIAEYGDGVKVRLPALLAENNG
ncbi:MAG: hypothetical protein FWG36_01965 [Oscillospiraceae bacterium]|nr:hypothetical protein [Oscillospiraceae bacterium]